MFKKIFTLLISLLCGMAASAQNVSLQAFSNDELTQAFNNCRDIISLDDIPRSYWTSESTEGLMFINCFLIDPSNTLTKKNIAKMRLYDQFGLSWTIDPQVSGLRIGSWENNFTSTYSYDGGVLLLGEYTVELELNGGKVLRRKIKLSDYDGTLAKEGQFLYSNGYKGNVGAEYVKSLNPPEVLSAKIKDEKIEVTFRVNVPRVKNAVIYFYDSEKKYFGDYELYIQRVQQAVLQDPQRG